MVFQAFMDESQGGDGTLVIAGHIATAENWANLSREWEAALPGAIPRPDPPNGLSAVKRFRPTDERPGALPRHRDRFHVHVAEMSEEGRRQKLPVFFRIIERHVALSLSARVHLTEIERAKARVYVPGLQIDWGFMDIPWMVAWRVLMDRFHYSREAVEKVIPLESTIDFYFDERAEKKVIREAWEEYIETRPEPQRQRYGREPRFEDDQDFLGLQAADLWAWWVRKWHAQGAPETMEFGEAGGLGLGPTHPKMDISIDEEGLVLEIKKIIAEGIEPGRAIYDAGALTRSLNEVSWGPGPGQPHPQLRG